MRRGSRLVLMFHVLAFLATASVVAWSQPDGPELRCVCGDRCQCQQMPRVVSVFASEVPAVTAGQVVVQRHLYTACVDVEARQAAWVAYHVKRRDWDSDNVLSRNFHTPRSLRAICLEQSDYAGSGVDLGHLYGLQFVSANPYAAEVNELCVIAGQPPAVNRGPWLQAENRIKALSADADVAVLAGQLWLEDLPPLPAADEPHRLASHWWLLVSVDDRQQAWLIPHTARRSDDLERFVIDPKDLRPMVAQKWWME